MIKYFTIEDLLKHYLQKKFHILVGFYTVDKQFLERNNMEYNKENIAMMLFYCRYTWLGYVSGQNEVFDQMEK